MTTEAPPLLNFKIVGVVEKTTAINAGTPAAREVPGGSCWHCGTSIRICVQAKNLETGEVVDIGTTCAERIGLDRQELKRYLAERFAEQRYLRSKAYREAHQAEYDRREAEQAAAFGPHGSSTRFGHCNVWGEPWNCDECRAAAPHGTWERFFDGPCSCGECLEAVLQHNRDFRVAERPVLVDLRTGTVVDRARVVSGQYGSSWLIPSEQRGWLPTFVPMHRARRATVARRGYTYASALFVVRPPERRDDDEWRVRRLTDPLLDEWREPVRGELA